MPGRVAAVCTSKEKGTVKQNVGSARLLEEYGIEGDAHGGFAHRQISLIATEDIESMKAKLPDLVPGSFAENITTEGLDLASLSIGDRLEIGECFLEVSQIGKECHSKCEVFKLSGDCIMPKKGIFCRVLRGGSVKIGDSIMTHESAAKSQLPEKFFNIAGPNVPEDHYMLDPLRRINYDKVSRLIRQKQYFVLHAPRQTGKTTSLLAMTRKINEEGQYHCVYTNVESAQTARNDVEAGMRAILMELGEKIERFLGNAEPLKEFPALLANAGAHKALSSFLNAFCQKNAQPLVLFIDEIDALIGDTLTSVLRQLRSGYESRPRAFPMSVVLCGVRDVRDYRIHMFDGAIVTGDSCFNIKAESLRLGDFSRDEIQELYEQHSEATGQIFEEDTYQAVWDLTHGQPWLVNALARQAAEMPETRDRNNPITLNIIEQATEALILERAAHLDQLADKLHEERVQREYRA